MEGAMGRASFACMLIAVALALAACREDFPYPDVQMDAGPDAGPDCLPIATDTCYLPCWSSADCPAGLDCVVVPRGGAGAVRLCQQLPGQLGEPCGEAPGGVGSCGPGLGCARCPEGDLTCCVAGGQVGEPCFADGTCAPGLACADEPPYISTGGLAEVCLPAGGQGDLCFADRTCNDGLACLVAGVAACTYDSWWCCEKAAGCSAGWYLPPYYFGCPPDLACVTPTTDSCPSGLSSCCLPAGELPGDPCWDSQTEPGQCRDGLTCRENPPQGCRFGQTWCCQP